MKKRVEAEKVDKIIFTENAIVHKRLKKIAEEKGIPMSRILRQLVRAWLSEHDGKLPGKVNIGGSL